MSKKTLYTIRSLTEWVQKNFATQKDGRPWSEYTVRGMVARGHFPRWMGGQKLTKVYLKGERAHPFYCIEDEFHFKPKKEKVNIKESLSRLKRVMEIKNNSNEKSREI